MNKLIDFIIIFPALHKATVTQQTFKENCGTDEGAEQDRPDKKSAFIDQFECCYVVHFIKGVSRLVIKGTDSGYYTANYLYILRDSNQFIHKKSADKIRAFLFMSVILTVCYITD